MTRTEILSWRDAHIYTDTKELTECLCNYYNLELPENERVNNITITVEQDRALVTICLLKMENLP